MFFTSSVNSWSGCFFQHLVCWYFNKYQVSVLLICQIDALGISSFSFNNLKHVTEFLENIFVPRVISAVFIIDDMNSNQIFNLDSLFHMNRDLSYKANLISKFLIQSKTRSYHSLKIIGQSIKSLIYLIRLSLLTYLDWRSHRVLESHLLCRKLEEMSTQLISHSVLE